MLELTHGFRAARMPITIVRREASVLLDEDLHARPPSHAGGTTTCTITMTNSTFDGRIGEHD